MEKQRPPKTPQLFPNTDSHLDLLLLLLLITTSLSLLSPFIIFNNTHLHPPKPLSRPRTGNEGNACRSTTICLRLSKTGGDWHGGRGRSVR
ncbi:hypothetical protein K432DRAFT_49671 [Lepidopterella palustris CBS 459.81]|uniref:Transmembrane protein n=1 Tax=Lepidopterella palustris CBS 459.81 TaxID=1314670 RepID=A0A8E2EAL2_9PEZI|nr:hypothetical protein K432DRAFT_49671 [Lepidopterella palustris CBS 459.81]